MRHVLMRYGIPAHRRFLARWFDAVYHAAGFEEPFWRRPALRTTTLPFFPPLSPPEDRQRRRHLLSVVFVQQAHDRYPDSLERLLEILGGLESAIPMIVAVDNRQPGRWMHRISGRLFQIGGDPSAGEFSAFDRGVAFLEAQGVATDLYAFVTDAFVVHGEELPLLDDYAVEYALALTACVGWVESAAEHGRAVAPSERGRLQIRFFLMPASVHSLLGVFDTALETSAGDGAAETVRERRLSARLVSEKVPCFDVRLIRSLAIKAISPAAMSREESESWQWRGWVGTEIAIPPRYALEVSRMPHQIRHGDWEALEVAGWAATSPQVPRVVVALSESIRWEVPCDLARPDVVDSHPEYPSKLMGFSLQAALDSVPPGTYTAEWILPGTVVRESLGKLHVLPRLEFTCTVCFAPWEDRSGQGLPIWLEGELLSTGGLDTVEVLWNGESAGLDPSWSLQEELSNGLRRYHLLLDDSFRPSRRSSQNLLELRFHNEAGATEAWTRSFSAERRGAPVLHVDKLAAAAEAPDRYRLELAGWVDGASSVDYLSFRIADQAVATFGLEILRPDVTEALGGGLVTRRGFHLAEYPLTGYPPGDYPVEITAGPPAAGAVWRGVLRLPEPRAAGFLLVSEDLEKLRTEERPIWWASLAFRGQVTTSMPELRVLLEVDGRPVDQQSVSSGGAFTVRYAPDVTGPAVVRVVIESRGKTLYDSGPREVVLRRMAIRPRAVDTVGGLLERFSLRERFTRRLSLEALVRRFLERELENLSSVYEMLESVEEALMRSSARSGASPADLPQGLFRARDHPRYSGSPLRVLFATWEVPSLRHGGGVWMTNLLKDLGRRHRITLLHTHHPEEKGWVEDVRPHVDRVISVPRPRDRRPFCGDPCIPHPYRHNYTPELRRILEAEVRSGDYDLVDYEYTMMYPHIVSAAVPQVLTMYELSFAADLKESFDGTESGEETVARLSELVKEFYFETTALPAACRHLITVTEEDGRVLAEFSSDAEIYVNTLGVDLTRFSPSSGAESVGLEDPTLVFLGNFRHPPNVHAAEYFASRVMPLVRRRCPQVRFLIVGSHPPAELCRHDRRNGITVTGFVEDVRPYLREATAFVAPIFSGTGMRVKLLEAMACGCPVIATRLAMRGLAATSGESCLLAESARDFAEATCRLIEDRQLAAAIGSGGRRLVTEKHSLEAKAAEREAIWGMVLAGGG